MRIDSTVAPLVSG